MTCFSNVFLYVKTSCFSSLLNLESYGFVNKISTLGEKTFNLVVFPGSSKVSMSFFNPKFTQKALDHSKGLAA